MCFDYSRLSATLTWPCSGPTHCVNTFPFYWDKAELSALLGLSFWTQDNTETIHQRSDWKKQLILLLSTLSRHKNICFCVPEWEIRVSAYAKCSWGLLKQKLFVWSLVHCLLTVIWTVDGWTERNDEVTRSDAQWCQRGERVISIPSLSP